MIRCRRYVGLLAAGAVAIFAIVTGCDDRPQLPPNYVEQQPPAPATEPTVERPTTQELISGPYTALKLDPLPIRLSVPSGWKLVTLGAITMLEGPTPSGDASIRFADRGYSTQQNIDLLYRREKGSGR